MFLLLTTISFLFLNSARVKACSDTTSSYFSTNTDFVDYRGYLITPNSNNATCLTTAIYNCVYNASTSNASIWTSSRRLQFNSYWNSIKAAIWDDSTYPTYASKINRCIYILSGYSTNICSNQAELFGYFIFEFGASSGSTWGCIGDFVACGNASSNYSLPSATSSTSSTTVTSASSSSSSSSTAAGNSASSASTASTSSSYSSSSTTEASSSTASSSTNSSTSATEASSSSTVTEGESTSSSTSESTVDNSTYSLSTSGV